MTFELKISGDRKNVTVTLKHDGEVQEIEDTLRMALARAAEFMGNKWRQEN